MQAENPVDSDEFEGSELSDGTNGSEDSSFTVYSVDPEEHDYVCLRSGDDHDFWIPYKWACRSDVLKDIITTGAPEHKVNDTTYKFRESSAVMRIVVCYLGYSHRYREHLPSTSFEVEEDLALPCLEAATFFGL
ncbi:unnamed protein product, partial [Mesorhabditis spiculigera]